MYFRRDSRGNSSYYTPRQDAFKLTTIKLNDYDFKRARSAFRAADKERDREHSRDSLCMFE